VDLKPVLGPKGLTVPLRPLWPCRASCGALESGHPGHAPAGRTAGSARGRETGFAPR